MGLTYMVHVLPIPNHFKYRGRLKGNPIHLRVTRGPGRAVRGSRRGSWTSPGSSGCGSAPRAWLGMDRSQGEMAGAKRVGNPKMGGPGKWKHGHPNLRWKSVWQLNVSVCDLRGYGCGRRQRLLLALQQAICDMCC